MSAAPLIKSEKIRKRFEDAADTEAAAQSFDDLQRTLGDAFAARAALPSLNARLETLERRLTTPVEVTAKLVQPAAPKAAMRIPDVLECVRSAVTAEFLRRVKQVDPDQTLRTLMPGDNLELSRDVAKSMLVKSQTGSATTTDTGWAAELVRSSVLAYWRKLAPVSIAGALVDRGLTVPLEFGPNGSLTVPMRAANGEGNMRPAWISEGSSIPHVMGSLGSMSLTRNKLAAISTFSDELASVSIPGIADIAETFILDDVSVAIDEKLFSADAAVPVTSPAGLRNGLVDLTPGMGPLDDLRALLGAMAAYRARRPVFVCDINTALALRLWRDAEGYLFKTELEDNGTVLGVPLISSANAPANRLTIMDAASVYLALGIPQVDITNSATIVLVNADGVDPTMTAAGGVAHQVRPQDSVEVSDAAGMAGGPSEVISTFQQAAQAIRVVIDGVSWGKVHPDAIASVVPGWTS